MIAIAQITDTRACCAVGTVKKRIRMCGRPAVPNTSAMPSEIWSIGILEVAAPARGSAARAPAGVMFCRRIAEQRRDLRLHLRVADDRLAESRAG